MRILVTGGSSDIAFAISKRRIAMGDDVIITSSSEERLDKTLKYYSDEGLSVKGIVYQFETPCFNQQALEMINRAPIDAVILNAFSRVPTFKRIHELPFDLIEKYVTSNVMGNIWLIQQLLPAMIKNQFGRLVLISSVSAQAGTSCYGIYCTAKSALEGFFLNLAVDYGQDQILANIVRAGLFKTSRTKSFWHRESYQQKMAKIIPQGAMGEPGQLAESLEPLLSATSYMTGSVLIVSGGLPLIGPQGLS